MRTQLDPRFVRVAPLVPTLLPSRRALVRLVWLVESALPVLLYVQAAHLGSTHQFLLPLNAPLAPRGKYLPRPLP